MLAFLLGFIFGVAVVAFVLIIYIFEPFGKVSPPPPFIDQFRPIQIPEELKQFLKSGEDGQGISRWESCHSLSLFMHMFFQEHKDTRQLRRWVHKRLQMELNDIATRSAAGRLLQEIRIRDLCLGTKFPCLNAMRVESVEMSEDGNIFEKIVFVMDVDYKGGFETSIDVTTMFGKKVNLSVRITKLAGLVRFVLSRKPFTHWAMSFVSAPIFETDISSQIQGHQLKRLIPLIKESFRRALQRKHVWPNYKIRYRPIFPNPLLQPSPPLSAFKHVKLEGGLEVTVLQCSRLKTDLVDGEANWEVYCTLSLDQRPFLHDNSQNVAHSLSVMLIFSRYDLAAPIGIEFEKHTVSSSVGPRPVRIASVTSDSLADKAEFKPGDTFVAINSVPIRSERQVVRFMQQTIGDLMVLVDRNLDDIGEEELRNHEELIGEPDGDPDDAFVALGCVKMPTRPEGTSNEMCSPESTTSPIDIQPNFRRHSISLEPCSLTSAHETADGSLTSSLHSLDANLNIDVCASAPVSSHAPSSIGVQRTESARVPHVLVSQPSIDLRRTRSESQIDALSSENTPAVSPNPRKDIEEEFSKSLISPVARERPRTNEDVDILFGNVVDGKDGTLVGNSTLPMTREGSAASLLSSVSNSVKDGTEDEESEEPKLTRDRPHNNSRRHKFQATLQAGKKKMLDLMPQKSKKMSPPGQEEPIEVGAEATECQDADNANLSPAHVSGNGRKSPMETLVVDKKDKKKRKKSASPRMGRHNNSVADSPTSSVGSIRSRNTKATPFRQNVLWGQSLHFDLDSTSTVATSRPCKYLNVTIHAKQTVSPVPTPTGTTGSRKPADPQRPVLLGYVSLYIPQLVDDCMLTLSNCHREVFTLKPPARVQSPSELASCSEYARHNGFDPRLCYGDITLGFRYFPEGLPQDAALNAGDDIEAEPIAEEGRASPLNLPSTSSPHEWGAWSSKSTATCAMCRGKIWLKNGSCCQRCLVICHQKCTSKANLGIICTPHTANEADSQFEDLDSDLNICMVERPTTDVEEEVRIPFIPVTPQQNSARPVAYADNTEGLSRRSRLKNKVTEKFSLWRKKPKKENVEGLEGDKDSLSRVSVSTTDSSSSASSPMASIQDCLADILPLLSGSPFISNLYYQPGNAYNERTVNHARDLGKEIFAELNGQERVDKINDQIDIIQAAIRETKEGRLVAMKDQKNSKNFEGLDERLQALAVLMLHYCAGLQDCAAKEGRSSTPHSSDSRSGTPTETTVQKETLTADLSDQSPGDKISLKSHPSKEDLLSMSSEQSDETTLRSESTLADFES